MAFEADAEMGLAGRFIHAQSWWIASELCRRKSTLYVRGDRPMGGFYRGLTVTSHDWDESGVLNAVFMNGHGRIHIHAGRISTEQITWAQTFASEFPHDIVKQIETSLGWATPTADATTRRSLIYRVLAACLWQRVNDRLPWSVVDGLAAGGYDSWTGEVSDDFLGEFFGAQQGVDSLRASPQGSGRNGIAQPGPLSVTLPRVWVLLRGTQNTAVLLDTGILYRRGEPPVDLLAVYRKHNRLDDVASIVLASEHSKH